MSKLKQKIVLFIEKNDVPCLKFTSIGNFYMNRFVIDEEEASEMINIFHLQRENEDQKGTNCSVTFFKNVIRLPIHLKKGMTWKK